MKTLGIIPARGGSKRVPGKNIRLLYDKPLIAYTIETSLLSECIDRVVVSTDDAQIAEVGLQYGAEVPFIRPKELAEDSTPDQPVLQHALSWLKKNENWYPEVVFILRPTTPFKTEAIIKEVFMMIESTQADLVRTVSISKGVFHPFWAFKIAPNGFAKPFIDGIKITDYYQAQLLPPAYRLNGVVDAMRAEVVFYPDYFDAATMAMVEIPAANSLDIDTELDFQFCKFLMQQKLQR